MAGIGEWWARLDLAEARGWITAAAACAGAYLGLRNLRLNIAQRRREAAAKEPHFETNTQAFAYNAGWFQVDLLVSNRSGATIVLEVLTISTPDDALLLWSPNPAAQPLDIAKASRVVKLSMMLGVGRSGPVMADAVAGIVIEASKPSSTLRFRVYVPQVASTNKVDGDLLKIEVLVTCRTKGSTDLVKSYPVTLEARTVLA